MALVMADEDKRGRADGLDALADRVRRMRVLDCVAVSIGAGLGVALLPGVTGLPLGAIAGGLLFGLVRLLLARRPWERAAKSLVYEAAAGARATPRDLLDSEILAEMPVSYLVVDGTATVVFCSAEAKALLMRDPVGRHISVVFRAPVVLEAIVAAINTGTSAKFEFIARRPREMHLESNVRALSVSSPQVDDPRAVLAVQDITPLRQTEAMRIDFVANASHELRTPLTAIGGLVETVRAPGPARDDPVQRDKFLGIVSRQVARMSRLVDDLLALSRIELEENNPPTQTQDLRGIIEEAVATLAGLAEGNGNTLEIQLPPSLPPVLGVRDELLQVVLNLLGNAIKYGGPDRPILIREAQPKPGHPGWIGIVVEDFGPGVDIAEIPRLTERFYRVNKHDSIKRGGTGLGLAIVKHILNRHRGVLDIESAPGEGAKFIFRLPSLRRQ